MKDKIIPTLCGIGLVLILVGILIPFFTGPRDDVFKYIFGAGALLNLAGRLFTRYNGRNLRLKRLLRIETWAAIFFCAAVYFMFADPDPRNWIVFILAGGVLMAYTSFMIQKVQRAENSDRNEK